MTSKMVKNCNEEDTSENETVRDDEEYESIYNPTNEKFWR